MTIANEEKQIKNLTVLRKEKGLKISEVAEKLKLTSDVIKKLEKGEFEKLGAYPYVRGYLINYANLLETEPEDYIALIPRDSKRIEIVNTYSKSAKLVKFKRQSKGLGSYVIGTFIVLTVSFSGWYLLKVYSNKNEINQLNASTSLELTPKSYLQDQQDLDLNPTIPTTQHSENESFHYSSLIPGSEELEPKQNNELMIDSSGDSEIEGNENIDSTELALNSESIDKLVSKYVIEVNVLETSWIKIENTNGEKLFFDLFKPGKQVFESDSPIHFRIGNQSKVEVSINGEIIDISKYSTKNISDFDWPNIN